MVINPSHCHPQGSTTYPGCWETVTWLVMNKADTTMAKAKDLTERSPFLEFPMMMLKTGRDDWSGNHFLPKGWEIDKEGDEVF